MALQVSLTQGNERTQIAPPAGLRGTPSTSPASSITAFKVREKYRAGVRLLRGGHVLAAIQQFQEASFFDAEDALPIVALAECYVFLCDLRSAVRCYRRALWSLHKRKQRPLLGGRGLSSASAFGVDDAFLLSDGLSSPIPRKPSQAAAQPLPLPAPLPPQRPSTAQFSSSPAFLSDEVLHAVVEGRSVPAGALGQEADVASTEQAAEDRRQSTRDVRVSSLFPQTDGASVSTFDDGPSDTDEVSPQPTVSQETALPCELTAAEVRARLAGVLDALSLALFQVGSVEQALRCTTEALELHAAGDAEEKEGVNGQAGYRGRPAALGFLTKSASPYLSEPTIALHRAVFLIALQREEEAEDLLDIHYELFEDWRAQSAPLLIELYCNRQAFRKARLLLESQEEALQRGAAASGEEKTPASAGKAASATAADADIGERPTSASLAAEGEAGEAATEGPAEQPGAPAAFSPLPAPLSLTIAKYIFTELYARYRSAALASNDEDSVTRCLDVYPNDVDLLFRRAQLRIAAGDLKRSIKDLFRCVQDTNGEHKEAIEAMTTVLFTIGSSLEGESEVQNTVTYYSESLKWRPDNLLVLLARGDCYTKMEAFEDALTDYQAILNYAPEHSQAQARIAALHDLWGRKFFALDSPAQAEAEFTNAIKADSKNPEFYYHRALCRLKLGQGQYALRDVLSCKELNPSAPHLRAFIARYMEPMQLADAAGGKEGAAPARRAINSSAPASGSHRAPSVKTSAAAKWYGPRTLPLPPAEGRHARGKVDPREKRSEGSVGYATSSPISRSASANFPPIATRSAPSRDAAAEGWVQGCQTTLHRRQGEAASRTK
ncbi:hypothetical protein ABL78_3175 [Leptomonas seymouri]|uniref:Tetratricopeptide repeat-containing protein n=1 Tax=Leptomonas seymouri TaxID=5684 RepID=A0A0N0P6L1_LEPSE|nr:hypothetical protein ABL78_3175 [Leptomonas seymouri]|eukprot:KPI87766.1 hypothetical protein ABL78_3175 [Leptomonas seymouri]